MLASVVIVAAGVGRRFGSNVPKQFIEVNGKKLFIYTLEKFQHLKIINRIVLVVANEYIELCTSEINKYGLDKVTIVSGASERQFSVFNGIKTLTPDTDVVLIHDAVRPLVHDDKIEKLIDETINFGATSLGVPCKDTLKLCENKIIVSSLNREKIYLMHTPQCFKYSIINEAYAKAMKENFVATDDTSLVEHIGYPIKIFDDDYDNIKITTQEDLNFFKYQLSNNNIK